MGSRTTVGEQTCVFILWIFIDFYSVEIFKFVKQTEKRPS